MTRRAFQSTAMTRSSHLSHGLKISVPDPRFIGFGLSGWIARCFATDMETGGGGVPKDSFLFMIQSEDASFDDEETFELSEDLLKLKVSLEELEEALEDDVPYALSERFSRSRPGTGDGLLTTSSCSQADDSPWAWAFDVEAVSGHASTKDCLVHGSTPVALENSVPVIRISSTGDIIFIFDSDRVKKAGKISVKDKGNSASYSGQTADPPPHEVMAKASSMTKKSPPHQESGGCSLHAVLDSFDDLCNVGDADRSSKRCNSAKDEAFKGQTDGDGLYSTRGDDAVWVFLLRGLLFIAAASSLALTVLVASGRARVSRDNGILDVLFGRSWHLLSFLSAALVTWRRHRSVTLRQGVQSRLVKSGRWAELKVTVVLALLSSLVRSPHALNVSNPVVSTAVTWTAAESPVSVTGLVTITSGGTLTVMAGVVVVFETESSGVVNSGGALLILGNPINRVKLQPRGDGTWQGISFGPAAVSALFTEDPVKIVQYQGGSVVEYTDLLRAGTADLSALDFDFGTTPYLRHVNLVECDGRYSTPIWLNRFTGTFVADYIRLSRETSSSTYIPGSWLQAYGESWLTGFVLLRHLETMPDREASLTVGYIGTVTVLESTIVGRASFYSIDFLTLERNMLSTLNWYYYSAVVSTSYINVAFIRNNTIALPELESEGDALHAYDTGTSAEESVSLSVDFSGNTFLNGGMSFSCYSCQRNMTIASNTVDGSTSGGIKIVSSGIMALLNNVITNCNSTSNSYSDVSPILDVASTSDGSVVCVGNRVARSASAGALLTLTCGATSCTFENNVVQECSGSTLVQFKDFPWTFQRNLFVNTTAEWSVSIATQSPLSMKDTIALPANHWGVLQTDVSGPRLTVSDAFVLTEGPIVTFETVLSGPSTNSPLQIVSVPGGLLPDGTVGGLLDGNRTLKLPSGNYMCRLSFILRGNATLVFEGGVSIAFDAVRGVVLLEDSSLVTATGAHRFFNASASFWKGIVVDVNATTTISNLNIHMATVAINHVGMGGLVLDRVTVNMSETECVVSNPSGSVAAGSVLIQGSNLRNCRSSAARIEMRSSASFLNTSVYQAGGYGIYASTYSSLIVRSCTVEGTSSEGLYVFNSSSSLEIVDNTFKVCGVFLYGGSGCSMLVERNKVVGSMSTRVSSSAVNISSFDSMDVVVQDNIVEAWNISDSLAAFEVSFSARSYPLSISTGLDISRNHFSNISAGNVFAITYSSTKRATNIGNIFHRNLVATSTSFRAIVVVHAWPSDDGGIRPTMRGNIFHEALPSGSAPYYVQLRPGVSQVKSIDSSRSYWGNVSEATLVDRIFDGNDVSGFSILEYLPVLLTTDLGGPVGQNKSRLAFLRPGGILSGNLGASDNVTLEGGNFTAVSTLVVDGRLTILPGVQVHMAPGVSLNVRNGSLVVAGSASEPVRFVSAMAGSNWGQLRVFPNATGQRDLRLSNVLLTGAGSASLPAIHLQRVSELTNVTIQDCVGGGILVDGNFDMVSLNKVRSINVNSGVGSMAFNVKAAGSGAVTISNSLLSTFADTELAVYDSVRLSVENLDIYPKATSHVGVFATNTFTAIKNLTYDTSLLSGAGCAINSTCDYFELRSSRVIFGSYGVVVAAPSSTHLFEGNTWTGGPSSVNIAQVDGSVSFYNNSFRNSTCISHCFSLIGENVEFVGNLVDEVTVLNSQSLLLLRASLPSVVGNRFERISGIAGIELPSAPSSFNFSHNAWVGVSELVFFVKTTTLSDSFEGGVYSFPGNFWDGSSYEILQARTFDAHDDPRLALILYSPIFVDAEMTTLLEAPTASPCLDVVRRTISCVIRDASTVVVPAGLYYAPRPITLRHPNSLLAFEAGARIMFAPGASIRIDEGTFEVRGTTSNPVILTSTSELLSDFGGDSVQNSTEWVGVSFGPDSNPTVTFSDEYVSGSILQGCVIRNAGHHGAQAAVSIEQVSVMLRQVSVLNSGSDGVRFLSTQSSILVQDSIISGSASFGLHVYDPASAAMLQRVAVIGSGSYGLNAAWHQNLSISACSFDGNRDYQVQSFVGQGVLEVTERYGRQWYPMAVHAAGLTSLRLAVHLLVWKAMVWWSGRFLVFSLANQPLQGPWSPFGLVLLVRHHYHSGELWTVCSSPVGLHPY